MNNYKLSVKKYPVYKDSGVEWLGDVPEHWELKRLKDIIKNLESGVSVNAENMPAQNHLYGVLKTSCVNEYGFNPNENKAILPEEFTRVKCSPKKGRIIISRMNTPELVGASGYINEDYPNLFLPDRLWQTAFYRNSKLNSKWLSYLLLASSLKGVISCSATGSSPSMKNLAQEDFLRIEIPIPRLSEQELIADYLDTKTAQCDRKIDLLTQKATQYGKLKQSLINETVTRGLDKSVPMKDSGVEWIGDVPEHWEVVRNKQIFQERSILSSTGKETLLTVSHITGVTPRSEKNVNMFMAETMEGYKICHQGDLIINTMWAWMGALGTSKYFGICSPAYNVYMPVNNVPYDYRYFDYLYRTPNAIVEMTRNSKGIVSSRLRLYAKEFFQIETPLPPVSKQNAIADYLDKKTAQIDQIIQTINTQIEKLKELRKTLINDVVTGKIKV